VPALLLLVPEHPEVAEVADGARDEATDDAQRPTAVADRPARVEVDDADLEDAFPERLACATAVEVDLVRNEDREVEDVPDREPAAGAVGAADDDEDKRDDRDDQLVDEGGREARPEPGARAERAASGKGRRAGLGGGGYVAIR
jgi:hypothetical protein